MKPSEKAIEAAFRQEDRRHFKIYGEALEAAYAIDVDPLLADLNENLSVERHLVEVKDHLLDAKDAEIERLKKFLLAPLFQDKQRISELEAENAELKTEIKNWMDMDGWRT